MGEWSSATGEGGLHKTQMVGPELTSPLARALREPRSQLCEPELDHGEFFLDFSGGLSCPLQ